MSQQSSNNDKIQMGFIGSSNREVETIKCASVIEAGLVVRHHTDDSYSATTGTPIGVSLGKDLSDSDKTAVCRAGMRVAVKLTAGFDPAIGAQVNFIDATGCAGTSGAGATAVNAIYRTGRVGGTGVAKGLAEDGTTAVGVALIDFIGGL
jgi:hypothetical protein